jgi:hypothetical protein
MGISFEPDPISTGPTSTPWSVSAVLRRAPKSSAGNDQSRSNSRLMIASVRPRQ